MGDRQVRKFRYHPVQLYCGHFVCSIPLLHYDIPEVAVESSQRVVAKDRPRWVRVDEQIEFVSIVVAHLVRKAFANGVGLDLTDREGELWIGFERTVIDAKKLSISVMYGHYLGYTFT